MAFDFPNAPTVGQLYGAYRWDGEKWTVVGGAGMVNLTTQATGVLQAAQEPAHTGDVTNPQGSLAMTISGGVVGLAQMAPAAPTTIIGNNAGIVATPQALTGTQVTAMLDTFAGNKKALVPASDGSINNFLRGDGSWVPPPAASGYLPLTGGTMTGQLTTSANIVLTGPAGSNHMIGSFTGTNVAANDRWTLNFSRGAETGSAVGSDFGLFSYNDTGVLLGNPLTIERASGYVSINGNGATLAPTNAGPFGSGSLRLNKAAGASTVNNIVGQRDGVSRWVITLGNSNVETGSNAGTDLDIIRFTDAGALIDSPLTISRSTGITTFNAAQLQLKGGAGGANLSIVAAKNSYRQIIFASDDTAHPRWTIAVNNVAEGGSNVGADFSINTYNDAGAYLSTPMAIIRSTGVATFAVPIVNGSDRRLKDDIQPLTGALAQVEALQGVSYIRKDSTRREIGLIAQEVQAVVPELVFDTPVGPEQADWLGMKSGDPLLGIAYGNLVAVLIEAVKELSAKFAALEASIAP